MRFRIYYADNSTFNADPFDAPFFGVLFVVETDAEHGRRLVSNGDYYVWDGRWWARDFIGMIDYLQQPGPKKVICGRMVANDEWNRIRAIAEKDADFPARTGYGTYES